MTEQKNEINYQVTFIIQILILLLWLKLMKNSFSRGIMVKFLRPWFKSKCLQVYGGVL